MPSLCYKWGSHTLSSIADQDKAKDKVTAPAKQPQARHVEPRSSNQPISSACQTAHGLHEGMRAQLQCWAIRQSRLIDHESNDTRAIASCTEGTCASRQAAATCQTLTMFVSDVHFEPTVY